jgi:hypothetical protein
VAVGFDVVESAAPITAIGSYGVEGSISFSKPDRRSER